MQRHLLGRSDQHRKRGTSEKGTRVAFAIGTDEHESRESLIGTLRCTKGSPREERDPEGTYEWCPLKQRFDIVFRQPSLDCCY